jgi:2'-5' RNA ligase
LNQFELKRIFIAALFDELSKERINDLCLKLNVKNIARLDPHITIIPPFIVKDLKAIVEALQKSIENFSFPLDVELGPAKSFATNSPVIYLKVGKADKLIEIDEVLREQFRDLVDDQKGLLAHVTLARIKNKVKKTNMIASLEDTKMLAWVKSISILNYDRFADKWNVVK